MDYLGKCSIYTWKRWVSCCCLVECFFKSQLGWPGWQCSSRNWYPFQFPVYFFYQLLRQSVEISNCNCGFLYLFFQFCKFFAWCVLKLCHCGRMSVKNCRVLVMTWLLYRYEITLFVHGNILHSETFWLLLTWSIFSRFLL